MPTAKVGKPLKGDEPVIEAFQQAVEHTKAVIAANVCQTLATIERPKLATAISALTDDERDKRMKLIYRGFAERKSAIDENTGVEKSVPVDNCNLLFKVHDEI
jgi:hypothetical protein